MEDISDRISRLTQELRALHLQLQWPNFQDANSGDQDRIFSHLLNSGRPRSERGRRPSQPVFMVLYRIRSGQNQHRGSGLRTAERAPKPGHGDAPASPSFFLSAHGISGVC